MLSTLTQTPLVRRSLGLAALAAALLLGAPRAAQATGEIRTAGGGTLDLTTHDVKVEIVDQVAITKVHQVFHNGGSTKVDGTYLFPLPQGAQLIRFRATVGGQIREGVMKEKAQAAAEYRAAQAAGQEAALAEATPEGAFTVALANIAPGASPAVELEYIQLLKYDTGMVAYTYPLVPKGAKAQAAGTFNFHCDVSTLVPLTLAYSNSHQLDVSRSSHAAAMHLQQSNYTAEADLHLAYHVKRGATGMDVRLHRAAGTDHGYALIAVTPSAELLTDEILAKDITFVVDVSGSMKGSKIEQARKALAYCIRTLRPRDRFNIVTFSFNAHRLWEAPRHATAAAVREGLEVAEGLVANGGTNIGDAMVQALADGAPKGQEEGANPHVVVFLTDGKASSGETDPARIVDMAKDHLRSNSRVFTFGIGHDLNHFLLRQVAKHSHGAAAFVTQDHELELAISTFQQRIANPVLTDLVIEADGAQLSQIYPKNASFLFHGDQLLVAAKFTGSGPGVVRVTATAKGQRRTFELPVEWPAVADATPVLARLWALKKMQYLLDEVQLRGNEPELVKEVTALSLEYVVASPYTSFLVLDPNAKVEAGNEGGAPEEKLLRKLEELKKVDKAPGQKGTLGGLAAPTRRSAPAKDAGVARGGGAAGGWGSAQGGKSGAPTGGPAGPATGAAPATSGGTARPTAPTGPTGPAAPNSPAAPDPQTKAKQAGAGGARLRDAVGRKDAKPNDAPKADADREERDDFAEDRAEKEAQGRNGHAGTMAWLGERLADGTLTLADKIDLALTLEASGECRDFGTQVEFLSALIDALTTDAVAKLGASDRIRAALVRVESFRLTGSTSEKTAAQALLDLVGATLAEATGGTFDLDLALLARQSRNAGLRIPGALSERLAKAEAGAGVDALLIKLFAQPLTDDAKAAAQQQLAATGPERLLERSMLAAVTGADFDASQLWAGQNSETGALGSTAETLRRLRAFNASYWIGQGPK